MTKFKQILNETTGKFEFQFGAKLVSINTTSPQSYTNAAGEEKTYYLGAADFIAPNGTEQKGVTVSIHDKSLQHGMKIGDVLLTTLSKSDDGKLWLRMSHLLATSNVDAVNFADLNFDAVMAEPVVAEQPIATVA